MRIAVAILACSIACHVAAAAKPPSRESLHEVAAFVENYCLDCHYADEPAADLNLETFDIAAPRDPKQWDTTRWEKMVKRMRARQMPPAEAIRPEEAQYDQVIRAMEQALDHAAAVHPQPGRTDSIRRLNRTEYANAIRDLLALKIDAAALLPADQEAHGFDNVTLGGLTPTLLNRYLSAAERIAREAVGGRQRTPGGASYRVAADQTQQHHVSGLPLGTRGGLLVDHHFAQTGEYEVSIHLARDRDEHVEGLMHGTHAIDVLIDRHLVKRLTVSAVKQKENGQGYNKVDHTLIDKHLKTRLRVTAGSHQVGVTFPRKGSSLIEIKRQPFEAAFNRHRHPRPEPAIFEISITGPFDPTGPGETPSRRRVFARFPANETDHIDIQACAEESLRRLLPIAYRRPVTDADLAVPMEFFQRGRQAGGVGQTGYEAGMQLALTSVLINPHFLLRIETDPHDAQPGQSHPVSDVELASRLSFFLWSSLPDEQLLSLAEAGRLHERAVLVEQTGRMLADERSRSLSTNFAAQWLHLRNLDSLRPDMRRFTDFDDNLRQAMREETQQLFASMVRDDRSVLDLISTDTTYLNERLATHYGVAGVRGSQFRPVKMAAGEHRGGLLRHASILAVTSYATRTAPTIRGAWVLENLLGTPPPPPPPNVENLAEQPVTAILTTRERLAQHRENPTCASCHDLIDPIGLALENFDAVGRWRDLEGEATVDSSGLMPDGSRVAGIDELEASILARPQVFATAMTEKLLTFALGRGTEPTDGPAVRQAVRRAADNQYKFSSLIEGIVLSDPFRSRAAETNSSE